MKKIIRLTESDLTRIVKRVLMEQKVPTYQEVKACLKNKRIDINDIPIDCAKFIVKVEFELSKVKSGKIPDLQKVDPTLFTACKSMNPNIIKNLSICLVDIAAGKEYPTDYDYPGGEDM